MLKNKALLGIFLAVSLLIGQVVAAQAASNGQTVTPPTPTLTPGVTPSPTADPCVASTTSTGGTGGATSTSTSNPVASALCQFFNPTLGITMDDINTWTSDGLGYGEIAQACWMAQTLNNGTTCDAILQAKLTNDYSSLNLTGVTNWGLLKKYVFGHEGKMNLGQIVSGHAGGFSGGKPSWAGGGNGNGHGHGHNP